MGPLGLLSIQRTINRGWKIGSLSGIGAAASDLIYSSFAIFGMSFIDDILVKRKYLVNGVAGVLFLIIGISIMINATKRSTELADTMEQMMYTIGSTFLMGLSNPITFFIFLALFTKMGIVVDVDNFPQNICFILSIFTGSCMMWFMITNIVDKYRKIQNLNVFILMDKILGFSIGLFGILNILKVIIRLKTK